MRLAKLFWAWRRLQPGDAVYAGRTPHRRKSKPQPEIILPLAHLGATVPFRWRGVVDDAPSTTAFDHPRDAVEALRSYLLSSNAAVRS
jgi:hypothetical protein